MRVHLGKEIERESHKIKLASEDMHAVNNPDAHELKIH